MRISNPTIKFSVTSKSFSMGNYVDISWTDGPSSDEVELLVSDYRDGDFDGMEDIYNYRPNPENKPRAKYVSCRRDTSKEFEDAVAISLGEPLTGRDYDQERRVYSEMRKTNWVAKQQLPTPEERWAKKEAEFKEWEKTHPLNFIVTEVAQ